MINYHFYFQQEKLKNIFIAGYIEKEELATFKLSEELIIVMNFVENVEKVYIMSFEYFVNKKKNVIFNFE